MALGPPGEQAVGGRKWQPSESAEANESPSSSRANSAPSRNVAIVREKPTKLRLLSALHGCDIASTSSKLQSIVEALFHVCYHAATSHVPAQRDQASLLNTADGIRKFLENEPSLSWAAQYAPQILQLLRKRATSKCPATNVNALPSIPSPEDHKVLRKSNSAGSNRLFGAGGKLPPVGGGGIAACGALFGEMPSPTPPTWESNAKLAGIDPAIAVALSARLAELAQGGTSATAWLIVEHCRDCANHATTFRHDEHMYRRRFEHLKKHVGEHFSIDLPVEPLVSCSTSCKKHSSKCRAGDPPLRLCSFEVFLCFPEPLMPFGALALPCVELSDEQDSPNRASKAFSAVCLASKLRTLSWPTPEEVMARLSSALPRFPLDVTVKTERGLPVPNVIIEIVPSSEFLKSAMPYLNLSGRTDSNGDAQLMVLPCSNLHVRVHHPMLMEAQERQILVAGSSSHKHDFIAETVVQFWCVEDGRELVVYRSSPRSGSLDAGSIEKLKSMEMLKPFRGRLLHASGEIYLRCDSQGVVRGPPSLLAKVAKVARKGWKSARPLVVDDVDTPDGLCEYARLGAPPIEVGAVSYCCNTQLPWMQITIDDEDMGVTSSTGAPLSCCVKSGEHTAYYASALLDKSFSSPFTVSGLLGCQVLPQIPLESLRFVCVARTSLFDSSVGLASSLGSSMSKRESRKNMTKAIKKPTAADLFVVGGRLSDWNVTCGGPHKDTQVWMWSGELQGSPGTNLRVTGGTLEDLPADRDSGSAHCVLSQALTFPVSGDAGAYGHMQMAMYPGERPKSCAMFEMAQGLRSHTGAPTLWLGRLALSWDTDVFKKEIPDNVGYDLRVKLCTTCCRRGFTDASVSLSGSAPVRCDDEGACGIRKGSAHSGDTLEFRIHDVPHSLLPANTTKYVACTKTDSTTSADMEVFCRLWIWWAPSDEADDLDSSMISAKSVTPKSCMSSPKAEPGDDVPEGMIWLAADANHVPRNARPIKGMLKCIGAEVEEQYLPGSCIGPFLLRQARKAPEMSPCILSGLTFHPEPPPGFEHLPRDPSPLQERCSELGGCELVRLSTCPMAIGYFRQIQPPELCVSLTTSCCCRPWPEAMAALHGLRRKNFDSFGKAHLRRKIPRVVLDNNAPVQLQVTLENVPQDLMTGCILQHVVDTTLFAPAELKLQVRCLLYVYWIPPEEMDYDLDENGLLRQQQEGETPICTSGPVFIALHKDDLPDEAQAVVGIVTVPGATCPKITLEDTGTSPEAFLVEWRRGAPTPLQTSPRPIIESAEIPQAETVGDEASPDQKIGQHLDAPPGNETLSSGDGTLVSPTSSHARKSVGFEDNVVPDEEQNEAGRFFAPGLVCTPVAKSLVTPKQTPTGKQTSSLSVASLTEPQCLLAGLAFDLQPPDGFIWQAKESSALRDRCDELGGCELPRLNTCPVAVGSYVAVEPPPLTVSLRSSCCRRTFTGARLTLNDHSANVAQNDDIALRRKRVKDDVCNLDVTIDNVPACLLPRRSCTHGTKCGPFEPASIDLEVSCMLWVYWIPPEETDAVEGEKEVAPGKVYVVSDGDLPPPEAKPLQFALQIPDAKDDQLYCDGSSMGPFKVTMSKSRQSQEDASCLLKMMKIHVKPIYGYEYLAHDPSPFGLHDEEVGGCQLQRLAKEPVEVGIFNPVFPPPYNVSLVTSCCNRGFAGASATLIDHSTAIFDENGTVAIKRKREMDKTSCDLVVQVEKIPMCLLPGASVRFAASCRPMDEISTEMTISCLVYIYWTLGEDDPDADDEDAQPADAMVWIACDVEHLPTEIHPVEGTLSCPGAETEDYELDGNSVGPFLVQRPKDAEYDMCLLAGVSVNVTKAPEGYVWRVRDPSPLEERCTELGGCELQRLSDCPQVIGYFKPKVPPPLEVLVRTTCCDRCFSGATISINNKEPEEFDEEGIIQFKRKRDQVTNEINIFNVPPSLLPGGKSKQIIEARPFQELSVPLDVTCYLWVYWIPPDEPDPEEAEAEDSYDEPMEGMLFVCADPEQIPDEALPLACTISCPGAEELQIHWDGASFGPIAIRQSGRKPVGTPFDECLLSKVQFLVPNPPPNYRFRGRYPSPLAERTEEFGGCELSRLITVPQAVGYLKPLGKAK